MINSGRITGQRPLQLRCGPAYRRWIAELGALVGRNNSDLIDAGLREIARQTKFRPPPRRCELESWTNAQTQTGQGDPAQPRDHAN